MPSSGAATAFLAIDEFDDTRFFSLSSQERVRVRRNLFPHLSPLLKGEEGDYPKCLRRLSLNDNHVRALARRSLSIMAAPMPVSGTDSATMKSSLAASSSRDS